MSKKPNVLLIMTDQQRFNTIQHLGHSHMLTPNLDRLASEGTSYVNAHSTSPVCQPARHDMLIGLPARYHGYYQNRKQPIKDYGIPTLPRIFSENGYRTASVGKLHFYPARMHHGFNEIRLMEEIPVRRQDDDYAKYLKGVGLGRLQSIHGVRPHVYHVPQNSLMPEEHHGTAWVVDESIKWLEENDGEPFFLFSSIIQPHPPWGIPEEYQSLYKDRELPEPIPISRKYPDSSEPNPWFGDMDSAKVQRKVREAYYSSITMLDKHIGRLLDYLEAKGLLENTIIIFTSDHGEMLQDKGYYSKELPYDSSVRIPFIIRYPKEFKQDTVSEDFVDLFDIMPTCLDLCDLDYPGEHDLIGGSLCAKEGARDRDYQISAYGEIPIRWIMSRDKRYKYIYKYNQGSEELYDMKSDPGEIVNLLETNQFPLETYRVLKQKALEFDSKYGPEGAVQGNEFAKYDGEPYHPSVHGKYHFWANSQMPTFNKKNDEEWSQQFMAEIEHALSNYDFSGVGLNEVFNEEEWKEIFMKAWEQQSEQKDIYKKLFK